MSIKKIKLSDGTTKWEVYSRVVGNGDKRIRRKFDKKIEAQEFLDSLKLRKKEMFNVGKSTSMSDITGAKFNEEADNWLKKKGTDFSLGYMRVINPALKQIRKLYGNYSLDKFTPELLFEYRLILKLKGASSATQNRYVDIMCRIIAFSFNQKRINLNPCIGYEKQKEIGKEINFWTEREIEIFLIFANEKYPPKSKGRWKYIAYLMLLETGLRANELWGIKLKDIPIQDTKLKVLRQLSAKGAFTHTKGKDSRNVPYSQNLRLEIEEWISWNNLVDMDRTLFVSSTNTPINHDNFSDRVFQKDMKEANVTFIRFHDLRHTALTNMVRRGVRIDVVQQIAGHKDLKTTMRYVHVLGSDISDVGASLSLSPKKSSLKPILKIV